jgi:hypothetical protein
MFHIITLIIFSPKLYFLLLFFLLFAKIVWNG